MNPHLIKYVVPFMLLFLLTDCSGDPVKQETSVKEKKTVKKKSKKKAKKKKKDIVITNENAVDFFTEYGKKNPETVIRLSSSFGNIDIELFTNTPIHRANIIYLTKRKYFDLTQFYRVSKNFVLQAGNSDETDTQAMRAKIGHYTLPAEFREANRHFYGSVAMARRYDKNPTKRSSPYEFYINLGRKFSAAEMKGLMRETGLEYPVEQKNRYINEGGNPSLDLQHTVVGRVIRGMDVALKINEVKVDGTEWPLNEIPITVRVVR
ncbi:MAG TPA: peptidylprolyl isomerase [Flavobacteriales bacterium]|jgi:peptidyl-prolyl cis-trans isomerase A (cyclophilin A)|nr:peptidylprolyl isomerase [Flavobacteriales bacterium]